MFGPHVVINQEHGARNRLDAQGALVVGNDHQSVVLSPLGDVSVLTSLERSGGYEADRPLAELMGIVEDDIRPLLASSLGFAASLLDHIDGTHRRTTIAPGAVIHGVENVPWVTREQAERSPGRTSLGMGERDSSPVFLSPLTRPRPVVARDTGAIAEDLLVVLRRQFHAG